MKFRQKAKRIFTAALIVWMSGVVLFLCCNLQTTNAAGDKIESCPLAKKGDCVKTTAESDSEHSFRHESRAFDCCAFPAKIFDKVRKIEKSPEMATAEDVLISAAPKFSLIEKTFRSPSFYQSFTRDRAGIYLQNCVFRI